MCVDVFEKMLVRFLEDQERTEGHQYFGQFGRTRKIEERRSYQKDEEPLVVKPQFFMTYNAVQILLSLRNILDEYDPRKQSKLKEYVEVLQKHSEEIKVSTQDAGEFAERLLLKHDGQIVMQDDLYHKGNKFISHRHTIGAAIILMLLNRQPKLLTRIVKRLLDDNIQRADGGWPIADSIWDKADFLCSSHAAYLLHLAQGKEQFKDMGRKLRKKLDATLAYLLLKNFENDGYWIYLNEADKVPITARTFPELFHILMAYGYDMAYAIPEKLLEHYPVPVDAAEQFNGIENTSQLEVRLGAVFRLAGEINPNPFLDMYLRVRKEVLGNYSNELYYSTYELCCLLSMILDQFEFPLEEKVGMAIDATEHLLSEIPFFGKMYTLSKETRKRLKEQGLLD